MSTKSVFGETGFSVSESLFNWYIKVNRFNECE